MRYATAEYWTRFRGDAKCTEKERISFGVEIKITNSEYIHDIAREITIELALLHFYDNNILTPNTTL